MDWGCWSKLLNESLNETAQLYHVVTFLYFMPLPVFNKHARYNNVRHVKKIVFRSVAEDPELTESKRRRFRTKRMRPDFFNPLDMEYSSRRRVKVGVFCFDSYAERKRKNIMKICQTSRMKLLILLLMLQIYSKEPNVHNQLTELLVAANLPCR